MDDPTPSNPSRSASRDQLSELVVRCLERMEKEGTKAIESLCNEYPEHSEALRAQLENLARMGLLDDPEAEPQDGELPERLGEFKLLRRLGGGGMGVVYLAEQESLKRQVALKLIRPEHLYFPKARARFVREIEAIARLSHPGIVQVYAAGETQKIPFFAMEVIDGISMQQVFDAFAGQDPRSLTGTDVVRLVLGPNATPEQIERHPWSGKTWIVTALTIAKGVAGALAHAHSHDIVHRDIKPSNVMLTKDGRAVLLDFGLATTTTATRLTVTGSVLGSVYYMAPEQISGRAETLDVRGDVWGLGVVLYEMLTLHLPFPGDDVDTVRSRILFDEPKAPREHNVALSWDAETVCTAALEKDPERRYASMDAFARDLNNVLELRPIAAKRASAPRRVLRWVQRHKTQAFGVALALVVFVLGPLIVTLVVLDKNREIEDERNDAIAARNDAITAKDEADARALEIEQVFEFQKRMLTSAQPGESGRDVKVATILEDASKTVGSSFPGKPRIEAAVRGMLGETWLALGLLDEADPHLTRAVECFDEAGVGDSENAAIAKARLGTLRSEQGKLADAHALLQSAAEALDVRIGGVRDARVGSVLIELANICRAEGKLDEAEMHAKRALENLVETRGESDRLTLGARGVLVQLMYYRGDFEHAEEESRKLVDAKSVAIGINHPETLITRQTLSVIIEANGNSEEAIEIGTAVAAEQERQLGADHADLLATLNSLASFYDRADKADEATKIRQRVLEARRRTLTDDHPDTIRAIGNLAHDYLRRGDVNAARPLAEEALAAAQRVLGPRHVDTLIAIARMGNVFRNENDVEKALAHFEQAATGATEYLGAEHPTTCEFRIHRAAMWAKSNRFEEAEAELLAVHAVLAKRFGEDGRRTQVAVRELIDSYTAWGKNEQAEAWRAKLAAKE
ncbi:MAG: tetratricopeptide repeat protein [Planctomycetes bacterium]|nr:tetratricopeptide repeat protein [Planctomycetota bacterium]